MLAQQLASMPLVVVPVPAPLAADRARSGAPIAAPPAGASPQRRAKEASCDSTAAAGAAAAPGGSPLLSLPADVTRAVLSRLLPADCAALRLSCRAGRAAAAPRVSRAALLERDLEAAAKLPLAALFPDLNEVRITLDGSSRADGSSSDDDDGVTRPVGAWRSPSAAQLPGRFAGSCTLAGGGGGAQRRGAGRGAVEARAAAVLERCVPEVGGGLRLRPGIHLGKRHCTLRAACMVHAHAGNALRTACCLCRCSLHSSATSPTPSRPARRRRCSCRCSPARAARV